MTLPSDTPKTRCGFCDDGMILRPSPSDGRIVYRDVCPYCDGTGWVQ